MEEETERGMELRGEERAKGERAMKSSFIHTERFDIL